MGEALRSKTTAILSLMAIAILLFCCGRKAPPVAWESIVPKRIVDLEAVPRDGGLLLQWNVPKENTDKSIVTDLAGFRVLRSEGALVAGECKGCGEKTHLVHEMKLNGKEDAKGRRMAVFFEDQEPGRVYRYQVVSVNRRGHLSSPSNPATVFWDFAPQPPRMVRGERGDKKVDLYWEQVEGASGFNVYRRGEGQEAFPVRPLNRQFLLGTHFTDLNVENEAGYVYSVRTVKKVVKTDVEGKGGLGVPVRPTDLVAPDPPAGLVAISLKDGIELNWRKSEAHDLLGYYVYRRKSGEEAFKRLNETPLAKEAFLDHDVQSEQDYEYAVTAVDHSPRRNESPRSEEVRVRHFY